MGNLLSAALVAATLAACAIEDSPEERVEELTVTSTTVVSEALARAVAETYHLTEGGSGLRTVRSTSVLRDGTGAAAMYGFNFHEGGFVVVAADFEVAPILAFGERDTIDLANLVAGQDLWASEMQTAIESVRRRGQTDDATRAAKIAADYAERAAWTPLLDGLASRGDVDPAQVAQARQIVEANVCHTCPPPPDGCTSYATDIRGPLLQTRWAQGCYFNDAIAISGASCGHAPVGCGPTAMSQIVFFHRYAKDRSFNWDMPLSAYGSDSQRANRALLMADTGGAAGAIYAASETSTTVSGIRSALTKYGYANSWGTIPAGPSVAIAQIQANRPMLMRGSSATAGHMWVVDGYKRKIGSPAGCAMSAASQIKYYAYNWGQGAFSAFYKEGEYGGYNAYREYIKVWK